MFCARDRHSQPRPRRSKGAEVRRLGPQTGPAVWPTGLYIGAIQEQI